MLLLLLLLITETMSLHDKWTNRGLTIAQIYKQEDLAMESLLFIRNSPSGCSLGYQMGNLEVNCLDWTPLCLLLTGNLASLCSLSSFTFLHQ
jgi:hypothetical protein